jgi:tripartite ATP-independent transporter DctP family solute receptor
MTRKFVAAAAAVLTAALCLPGAVQAAPKLTIRIGHVMAVNHFEHQALVRLSELVAQRSNGDIEIKVFPASQLGSEREQTEQVDAGALECHSSGGAIQNYAPALGAWSLPFLFGGPEHYDRVMDGPIGELLRQMLLAKSNIRILAFYPNGERMFFNTKRPFTKLSDFKGVKIRVDDQPISAQIWRALSANPVPIPFDDLYTSLQTGVVDAGENPAINIIRMKFYEVAKHVTTTRHSLTTLTLMCNEPWWKALPEPTRDLLGAAVHEVVKWRRQAAWDADRQAVDDLRKAGATISDIENRDEFQRALLPLYDTFAARTNSGDLIKAIQAAR